MRVANGTTATLGEIINTWAQTIAIVLAGLWGIYTFVYTEFVRPRSAPVNVSLNLELKRIDPSGKQSGDLTAVEMKASATNPSTREVRLFPSAWIAYAMSATPMEFDVAREKVTAARLARPRDITTVERYAKRERAVLVALGKLFGDGSLKPGENITRTIVFYVPRNKYDLVEVRARMPSAANTYGIAFEWHLDETDSLQPILSRIDCAGKATPVADAMQNTVAESLGIQSFESRVEASLWP